MTDDTLPPLPNIKMLDGFGYDEQDLRDYARAAIALEREACAKICDSYAYIHGTHNSPEAEWGVNGVAKAIRARSIRNKHV